MGQSVRAAHMISRDFPQHAAEFVLFDRQSLRGRRASPSGSHPGRADPERAERAARRPVHEAIEVTLLPRWVMLGFDCKF